MTDDPNTQPMRQIELEQAMTDHKTRPVADEGVSEADKENRMLRISKLIADMSDIQKRFGDTCVYVRRGGLSWGAVALNRQDDDEKHGVFDLQDQHDRDMGERLGQVQRLVASNREWMERVAKAEKERDDALARLNSQPPSATITLNPPTQEQENYLKSVERATNNYDPKAVVGGPPSTSNVPEQVREALEPFAKLADHDELRQGFANDRMPMNVALMNGNIVQSVIYRAITVGHLRRAREALAMLTASPLPEGEKV